MQTPFWIRFGVLAVAAVVALGQQAAEPRITSIHPLAGQVGTTYAAVVRGSNLDTAKAVFFKDARLTGRVVNVEQVELRPGEKNKVQLAHVEITAGPDAKPGVHRMRLLTASGLSNEISVRFVDQPVMVEPTTTAERRLDSIPSIVAGRLNESGETDDYWFEAQAGQTVTIEVFSGSDTLDPSVALYERSGSWFDPNRMNRVAFKDEALAFPAMSRDPQVSYRIPRTGKYCVRVQGFYGQGGPDSVYQLRVVSAREPEPELRPTLRADWEERELTRSLSDDWMQRVAHRGSPPSMSVKSPEHYRGVPEGSADVPVLKLPGVVEGVIAKPGETHVIYIDIEKAQDVAIEVETPNATIPQFTPVARLLEPGGKEIVGNIYTRLNNNNFKMMKAVKAKTTFSLAAPGKYTLQIHELTTDNAGDDFRYRVLVRPQIPHMGKFVVQQERINLERGSTRPVSVRIEREEGFDGIVAVQLENLPPGVTAYTAVENPAERPTLPNAGKPERYSPRIQNTSVILAAAPDAEVSIGPSVVRVVARAVIEGKLGEPIASTELPLTVIEKK